MEVTLGMAFSKSTSQLTVFPLKLNGRCYYTIMQLSERLGYHPVYLRKLLMDGKISGIQVKLTDDEPGYLWVATEAEILDYEANKDARGRPKNGHRK